MKWIVGVSIIASALGWAGTMTIPTATITPDEATLKYFPQETRSIAFVDVAALVNAPLVQDVLNKGQFNMLPQGLQEIVDKTGFDPRRDLNHVTVGYISTRERLIVADARYDTFKAEQFLKDQGKSSETYLGRVVYRDADFAVTFLDGVVLLGSDSAVRSAIDRITYPGSVQIGSDLLQAIRTIEAGSQIWGVGSFDQQDLPAGVYQSTPAAQILKSLRSGTWQMRVDRDLHGRATADFVDAQSAGSVTDMVRGLIAVAKLQTAKQQPDLLHVLDGIQVSNNGSSVVAQIDEPGDLLIKLQGVRSRAAFK